MTLPGGDIRGGSGAWYYIMNRKSAYKIIKEHFNNDLSEAEKGNAVKLDIYYSKAAGKAYLQLFEYIPYKYEPCSKMYEHQLSRIEKLIK